MSIANFTTTTSSAFLYCPPVTQTSYTTVYQTVLPAACETSSWMATYHVTETCTGDKDAYVTPTIPPGFVVTTVSCHVCAESEIVITCPGAQPTGMGKPTVHIGGNGVTATITALPVPVPTNGGVHDYPVATSIATPPTNGNGGNGCGGSGCGAGPGKGGGSGSGSGNGCGPGKGNENCNNGTYGNHPVVLVGAAASVTRSLMAAAGLAFLAGPFLLL